MKDMTHREMIHAVALMVSIGFMGLTALFAIVIDQLQRIENAIRGRR